MDKSWIIFLVIVVAIILVFFLCCMVGCSNNYLEWRRYDAQGNLTDEYKAGRQSFLVNSSWDVADVRLDPNDVSMTGHRVISDPERVRLVTPWGVIEGGDAASVDGTGKP